MSVSESCPLTNDECEFLLSLSDSELESFLTELPKGKQRRVTAQLMAFRTPEETARESLYEFVRQAWHVVEPDRDFIDGWHIEAICKHLEGCTFGKISNLLINVPPGHCKSRVCGVFFPAWVWIHKPSARFFCASYAQELATRDSIDCRYIIESEWYQSRWGDRVRITQDQNQKIKFGTTEHGWRMATSVGGRGTGEHPDFVIVDDPHNVRQAESELERQDCIRWWDATMSSRGLIRGVRRIVIMQRLHISDLSGHIINQGGFDHICLPYRYEADRMATTSIGWNDPRTEKGEILWDAVPQQMRDVFGKFPPRLDAGQLQQRPVPEGGALFKREWMQIIPDYPSKAIRAVRYWDKASSEDSGDYSAGVLIVAHEDMWYVADVVKGQWSIRQRNEIIKQVAELDAEAFPQLTIVIEQEPGSGGKESAEFTVRQLAGHSVKIDKVTGAKEIRAQPFADQCEAGNVRIVRDSWNKAFIEELCVFPFGDYDDQVDAAAGAFCWVARTAPYEAPDSTIRDEGFGKRHGVMGVQRTGRSWRR